jgi:Domain of unknown function (DUF6484)
MAEQKTPPSPTVSETLEEPRLAGGDTLLQLVVEAHEARLAAAAPTRIEGVVVGVLLAVEPAGAVRVTFSGGPEDGTSARPMAALGPNDVGHEVALLFEGGDPNRPVVMGKMHVPGADGIARTEVRTDGDRVELRAEKEIVLSCGDASITLTRAGKILIRGTYVLSRSSGVHRIQGGCVKIN